MVFLMKIGFIYFFLLFLSMLLKDMKVFSVRIKKTVKNLSKDFNKLKFILDEKAWFYTILRIIWWLFKIRHFPYQRVS